MNKYQEALEFLCDNSKFTQFNIGQSQWASETLQELVDKATPKKPLNIYYELSEQQGICPNCNKKNIEKIMELAYCEENNLEYFKQVKLSNCNRCGQALSWEEE